MKVKLIANVAVFTAEIKAEVLEKIQRHCPEALTLREVDPKSHKVSDVFKYTMGDCNEGAVSQYGITFDGVNSEGYPTVTMHNKCTCMDADKRKTAATEEFAAIVSKANALEDAITAALEGVEEMIKTTEASIEVID